MATAKYYPDALETLNRWYDEGHGFVILQLGLRHIELLPKNG